MSGNEAAALVVQALAFVYLAVVSIRLAWIDITQHRLPNRTVLPAYVVALALLVIASLLGTEAQPLIRALAGGAILFGGFFVMRLITPVSLGGGDVKLAGLLGVYLGWLGWSELLYGTFAAFLIGGVHALVLLVTRRADRRTRIAFGPALLGGAWIAIIVSVAGAAVDAARSATG